MKRLAVALLVAVGLASGGTASAQSYPYPSGDGFNGQQQGEAYYDYARVIRVDPVLDGRYGGGSSAVGQRCYETTSAGNDQRDGYDDVDGYRNDGYRNGGYYDPYGRTQGGSMAGRNIARSRDLRPDPARPLRARRRGAGVRPGTGGRRLRQRLQRIRRWTRQRL